MDRLASDTTHRSLLERLTAGKSIARFPFARLCSRLAECASLTRAYLRFDRLVSLEIAYLWFKGESIFPLVRLVLPVQDVNRRVYNVKETRIAKLFAGVLSVPESRFGMCQYQDKARVGKAAGDFGEAAKMSLEGRTTVPDPRPPLSPSPTLEEVNGLLTDLCHAESDADQRAIVLRMVRSFTPVEHKWLLRIILKDLKVRIRYESFLGQFHEVGLARSGYLLA